jgi:phosphomannomutase/phosphoglucomutase
MKMALVERTMFREYDIRGRVNEDELNAASGELIGRAYGTFLHKRGVKTAVAGYDCRVGSEEIKEGVVAGILSTGCKIIDLGMCTTPMMYWSQYRFNIMGGAMITGSHNPKGWSGLKLAHGLSYTLIGKELEELLATIETEQFVTGKGETEPVSILEEFAEDLAARVKIEKPFRVVVDAGNGVAGMVAPTVLREAGCDVIEQFCDLDPEFPNHDPDPALKATVEILGKRVVKEGADAGFAFDGDGDRLGVVDEKGQVIWPDRYMILLSRQILEKTPGAKIIFDVKCSQALEEDIEAHGGQPIMWKTGHSHIKAKLHEVKGLLAGEMSGHIFYVDNFYGFDDGVYTALRFAEYVSGQNESLSKIIEKTPYYISTPTIHVDCPDTEKYRIVDELTVELKKDFPRVIDINGARVMFDDGWGLVRASSNMPQLVLRFEAKTEKRLQEIKNLFRNYMDVHDEIGKEWENE